MAPPMRPKIMAPRSPSLADGGFDQEDAVECGEDADGGEREADGAVGPAIAVVGVDDVDVHQGLLGDVAEQEKRRRWQIMLAWRMRVREPTGLARLQEKGLRMLFGEGLGEDKEAVEAVEEREPGGDPEGQAGVDVAEDAAEGGAEDEADAEGCIEHAEGGGAAFARGDVGHVGHGGGNAGGGEAGDDAAEEEPVEGGRPGHEDVVEAEAEVGEEDDGAAAEAVGERPENGGEEELHGGEDGAEDAEHLAALELVAVEEAGR